MTPAAASSGLLKGEPLDLRLVAPASAAWLAAWVALGSSPRVGLTLAGGLGAAGFAVVVRCLVRTGRGGAAVRTPVAATLAAVLVCGAGAAAAAAWRLAAIARGPLPELAHQHARVTLDLTISADPRVLMVAPRGHGRPRPLVVVRARATRVDNGARSVSIASPVFVLAPGTSWSRLQPSQRVASTGRLAPPKAGEFETATFDAAGPPQLIGAPSAAERLAGRLRAGLRAASDPLPSGPRGLLPGLVDGDTALLPPEVQADFKTTGLTHLVAVSGANVAIVLGAALAMARWVRLGLRGQAAIGVLVVVGFVVVARPQPSVLRAAAMGLVAVVALVTGRRQRGLPALCAAVLLLIYVDPTLARSVGFALSACATGSLLVLAPVLRDRWARRLPRWLAEALAVPTAASLACAPLIAAISGRISLSSVPANLLAEPAVAPATICGVLTACVALVCLPVARLLAHLASIPCAWLVFVAHAFARLPASSLHWTTGAGGALGLAAVLAAFATASAVLRGRPPSGAAATTGERESWHAATRAEPNQDRDHRRRRR